MRKTKKYFTLALAFLTMIFMVLPTTSSAVEINVELGTAENFAILAGSTITNTGTTTISGDIGLHPGTVFSGQGTATVNGAIHLTDAVALQAKNDLLAAYNDALGRPLNTVGSELGGSTLTSGVYSSATSFQITGTLTLDGQNNPDAVFIFQAGSTLTTASASKVELINGANYNNIYWQVGSSATLGTNSEFAGNILSVESITVTTGATIEGRLLTRDGAVTLDNNIITNATTGSLTVVKLVTGDTSNISIPTFSITVTGPQNFTATKTFVANESFTWTNLVPGVYTVTESRIGLSNEWTVYGEGAVSVLANQQSMSTITNAYTQAVAVPPVETTPLPTEVATEPVSTPLGTLSLVKVVTGDVSDLTLPTFQITVTGPNGFTSTRTFANNESYTWTNLLPGVYTITENFSNLSSEWTVSGDGTIQVNADQTSLRTILNHYESAEAVVEGPTSPAATTEPAVTTEPAETTETTVPSEPTTPTIPQTGQNSNYQIAMFLGLSAAIFAGVGLLYDKKRKQFNG